MSDSRRIRSDLLRLLHRHQAMIRAYAYAITRDFALADDVHQEVALIVADRWHDLPHGDGEVPWLKQVVRRKALESMRRWRPARTVLGDAALAAIESAAHEDIVPDPRVALLGECLGHLDGDARVVVEGRYWRGLTCEQLAASLGRTVKAVYGILARTRLALAACVERSLPPEVEP